VSIVDVQNGKIRLGIQAPRDVPVFREELLPPGHKVGEPVPPAVK
jgi:sRNA-binding carbon storage regulator CsrA